MRNQIALSQIYNKYDPRIALFQSYNMRPSNVSKKIYNMFPSEKTEYIKNIPMTCPSREKLFSYQAIRGTCETITTATTEFCSLFLSNSSQKQRIEYDSRMSQYIWSFCVCKTQMLLAAIPCIDPYQVWRRYSNLCTLLVSCPQLLFNVLGLYCLLSSSS